MELLLTQAGREREARGRLYESVETKAGVVLGFAGVLAALGRSLRPLSVAGTVLAAATALAALWAFLPPLRDDVDMTELHESFASADSSFTLPAILGVQVRACERARLALWTKTTRLRVSMALLALSVVLAAIERVLR